MQLLLKSFNFGKIAVPDRLNVLLNLTIADELIPQATKFVTTIYKARYRFHESGLT